MAELGEILGPKLTDDQSNTIIDTALETVRRHLGMEIAYLSEFVDGQSVFRAVSAPGLEGMIKPGDSRPLDEVYCQHIIAGRLPQVIPDTAAEPLAMALPITLNTPIGSHVSIPIRKADGSVYGMFCCLSPRPNPSLNARDLAVMQLFADLSEKQVNRAMRDQGEARVKRDRVETIIADEAFNMVFQPIFDLATSQPTGFETLCRFTDKHHPSPDRWFTEAAELGLGVDLELLVIRAALRGLNSLPVSVYLSINASPKTVSSGALPALFAPYQADRIVLELTEHAIVASYDDLQSELFRLRAMGVLLAIDDAGAGYSGLQHIVRLQPDIIKLDMSLTSNIDSDKVKRSLAIALVSFATQTGAIIVAEGIETTAERDTVREIGISRGQGYLLGRPAGLDAALGLLASFAGELKSA